MIQDDLENLNFLELNDLEKLEFNLKLLENYNRTVQQLMVGRNLTLAGIMSIMLAIQTLDAGKLEMLSNYVKVLYKTVLQDYQINSAAHAALQEQAANTKQPTKEKETSENTDVDGVINVDGKIN